MKTVNSVVGRETFPFKPLTWFHLNNYVGPKEKYIFMYQKFFFPSDLSRDLSEEPNPQSKQAEERDGEASVTISDDSRAYFLFICLFWCLCLTYHVCLDRQTQQGQAPPQASANI